MDNVCILPDDPIPIVVGGLGCSDLVDLVDRIDGVEADMAEGRWRVVKRIWEPLMKP